jgi:flagellar M-ring protein FliF
VESLWSAWSTLDARRKAFVAVATLGVFAAIIALTSSAGSRDMSLLYAGLENDAAGGVIAALEQSGVVHEVRGNGIYVATAQRDQLRMTLAAEGLPAATSRGYELLDSLSGFGTTSQMFDAAYWRAKEGELARTILSNPRVRAARVHISTPSNRPFQRDQRPTAAVTVTTVGGTISGAQAKALRYLVASAVSGLSPEDVAVIDDEVGLIANGEDATGNTGANSRTDALRQQVQRLLEARVGYGNAVVELSIEAVTETETIVERRFDPEGRAVISTEVEERADSSQNSGGGDVTVASNLPGGDAAAGPGNGTRGESTESRALTNYEVSETKREVLRMPGAVRRLSVAVLVNDVTTTDATGNAVTAPRGQDELAALRELVSSAVGFDETRGDVITLKSMSFEPIALLGTEAVADTGSPLDMMSLIQLAVLAIVALVPGLFVVRPILTPARRPEVAALPAPMGDLLDGSLDDGGGFPAMSFPTMASAWDDGNADVALQDPVSRLRRMIEERQAETVEILQSWIEEPDEKERTYMGRMPHLESFDPPPREVEELPLGPSPDYLEGHTAGAAAAREAIEAEQGLLTADIVQALADISFGYVEARTHVLASLHPLFGAVMGVLLPDLARAALVPHLRELLEAAAASDSALPVDILVNPVHAKTVAAALAGAQSIMPFTVRADPQLGPARPALPPPQAKPCLIWTRFSKPCVTPFPHYSMNPSEGSIMDDLSDSTARDGAGDHPLRSVPIEITISVGRARPTVRDLLALTENAVLPLDKKIDDPVELYIGDRLIARGELQELEGGEPGQLAVRLTEVASLKGDLG